MDRTLAGSTPTVLPLAGRDGVPAGATAVLAQVSVAQFNADDALKRLDGGVYQETLESGLPIITRNGTTVVGNSPAVVVTGGDVTTLTSTGETTCPTIPACAMVITVVTPDWPRYASISCSWM